MILAASATLLKLVENWTTLEISLGAVARLKGAVEESPRETGPGEDLIPGDGWPEAGALELENVTVAYK